MKCKLMVFKTLQHLYMLRGAKMKKTVVAVALALCAGAWAM
jgi:hypothetical protein